MKKNIFYIVGFLLIGLWCKPVSAATHGAELIDGMTKAEHEMLGLAWKGQTAEEALPPAPTTQRAVAITPAEEENIVDADIHTDTDSVEGERKDARNSALTPPSVTPDRRTVVNADSTARRTDGGVLSPVRGRVGSSAMRLEFGDEGAAPAILTGKEAVAEAMTVEDENTLFLRIFASWDDVTNKGNRPHLDDTSVKLKGIKKGVLANSWDALQSDREYTDSPTQDEKDNQLLRQVLASLKSLTKKPDRIQSSITLRAIPQLILARVWALRAPGETFSRDDTTFGNLFGNKPRYHFHRDGRLLDAKNVHVKVDGTPVN